jgi:hypothetical protein
MAANATLAFAAHATVAELNELVSSTDVAIARLRSPVVGKPYKRIRTSQDLQRQARENLRAAVAQCDRLESFLGSTGIPETTLAVFKAWFKLQTVTEVAQLPEAAPMAAAAYAQDDATPAALDDPFEPLSAEQLDERLSVVAATVRQREQAHVLFSTLPPGRERGRVYPEFQTWPDIAGAPLRQTLLALGQPNGGTAWGFFASALPELEGLSPVEALSGKLSRQRPLSPGAQASSERRLRSAASQSKGPRRPLQRIGPHDHLPLVQRARPPARAVRCGCVPARSALQASARRPASW